MDTNSPRGIRNNNPLNLRRSDSAWLGKVANCSDAHFEQFTSIVYGYRAAIVNIRTILRRRERAGVSTRIRDLIRIWAPAKDGNNVNTYVAAVVSTSGISQFDKLCISNREQICSLVLSMAYVENGHHPKINRDDICRAYDLLYPRSLQK